MTIDRHFNPRSPRGERLRLRGHERRGHPISIHAPRVGSDVGAHLLQHRAHRISIHAPRVGSDRPSPSYKNLSVLFQSTLPAWGATSARMTCTAPIRNFNPRSPRGERLQRRIELIGGMLFQSTLPAWGATFGASSSMTRQVLFQSTLPAWGATGHLQPSRAHGLISIHAPRVGSDMYQLPFCNHSIISIHAPRVGSDGDNERKVTYAFIFQSTLPAWGATTRSTESTRTPVISIHAPRVGSDKAAARLKRMNCDFNPRSPRGERPDDYVHGVGGLEFQSTLPAWGATWDNDDAPIYLPFQSTLPAWGATYLSRRSIPPFEDFNPRSPRGERR